ncbi:ATP-binding cassette domain-containing protein [Micromonospora sp. C95]|uniref:ATP-binding cassette domain-containing protein n=1 Tax=Micromonospora sp. C95 TaxID=2824882 RepID=UPI001B36BD92|nr:ATP-binding cassette domain-containing protein [Micromonospora sp. C95]MBQ1022821.1 ATP-binding cassette domain-containing protein [Micromonospora sp. C95]
MRDLTVSYAGGAPALHGVTLHLPSPAVHAVIGSPGAGKTTLLRTIAGHLQPTAGAIYLDGRPVTGWPSDAAARAGVALAPQRHRLTQSLTVAEHLASIRPQRGRAWTVEDVLELFPPLTARMSHRAAQLSNGEQQMLTTACALRTAPRLLLADEPIEGLAPTAADQIITVLRDLPARGVTVLAALPHAGVAAKIADTLHVLAAGQLLGYTRAATASHALCRRLTLTEPGDGYAEREQ